ncbi:Tn3 family transposase [Tunturiibacter gelidiferens]|uniref:Tn3 family transposase n=1 Tax=Tunturiibacter gelidiferens TaxID=3069689 RepID=UPI0016132C8F
MANCLIFHNLCSLTRLVQDLEQRGETVPEDAIAAISPYLHRAHQPLRRLHPQSRPKTAPVRLRLHSQTGHLSRIRPNGPFCTESLPSPYPAGQSTLGWIHLPSRADQRLYSSRAAAD